MKVADILAPESTAIAMRSDLSKIEEALSEFEKISDGLADLAARYPVDLVYDVTSGKGMAEAVAHRAAWRDPRINVEKFRKTGKAPVLALGKNIDQRAAWLTEQLLAGETAVDEQIKAEEGRKESIKQAKIAAEFGRVEKIQEAIAEIHMSVMAFGNRSSKDIAGEIEAMRIAVLDSAVYQEQMPQAAAAHQAAIAKLEMLLKAKLHDEAEAAKRAEERAELEALRKAAAEQRAKDAVAAEAAAKVEREKEAETRKAAQAEQARLDMEATAKRAEADRIASEARVKAQAEHEAKMKAERDAAAEAKRVADEKAAKALAKRLKAEAADRQLRDAAPALFASLTEMVDQTANGVAGVSEACLARARAALALAA